MQLPQKACWILRMTYFCKFCEINIYVYLCGYLGWNHVEERSFRLKESYQDKVAFINWVLIQLDRAVRVWRWLAWALGPLQEVRGLSRLEEFIPGTLGAGQNHRRHRASTELSRSSPDLASILTSSYPHTAHFFLWSLLFAPEGFRMQLCTENPCFILLYFIWKVERESLSFGC